ncbi:hypothetical protein K3G63_19285 [Hymenobacter sp. HSC-4F20]|uniref:hypothetical protein n=1 Tax=Hymenobacter sp. HSC-4F20 TaxID=2864135 RepID=UPI001C72F39B|nr:hypothetical protein [Hymenobacter sp. HSC-4F20]MBX0292596.1 hypothetical protein [Hymenobacter sp. HSC-4F20]
MNTAPIQPKTIAIWYESSQGGTGQSSLDLHLNLWKLPIGSGSRYERFLDIGIKLHDPAEVSQLCLYFPFEVPADCFVDIVGKFINDSSLVSAIFNENYTVSSKAGSKSHLVTGTKGEQFDIYETSGKNVQRAREFGGTVFRVSFEHNGLPLYLRFRVSGNYPASLSITQEPTNTILQSGFSQTEMTDFRVNEARDLNRDLLVEMRKQSSFQLAKVHFFFVCSYGEDIVGAHERYNKCRNLENYRWASYVGNEKLKDQIYLAYQWRKFNGEDFGVLLRTKFERNNWRVLGKYLLVLLVITVLFNVISSYIFSFLPSPTSSPSPPCASSSPSSPSLPPKSLTAPRSSSSGAPSSKTPPSKAL